MKSPMRCSKDKARGRPRKSSDVVTGPRTARDWIIRAKTKRRRSKETGRSGLEHPGQNKQQEPPPPGLEHPGRKKQQEPPPPALGQPGTRGGKLRQTGSSGAEQAGGANCRGHDQPGTNGGLTPRTGSSRWDQAAGPGAPRTGSSGAEQKQGAATTHRTGTEERRPTAPGRIAGGASRGRSPQPPGWSVQGKVAARGE